MTPAVAFEVVYHRCRIGAQVTEIARLSTFAKEQELQVV
jgi:hypothetical protein